MTPEFMDELVVSLMILVGLLVLLVAGGLVADFILPKIPFVQSFLDSLPDWDEE